MKFFGSENIISLISKLELISFFNILMGWISLPIVGLMGLYDAKSIDNVVLTDLLAIKMQLTFIVYFLFIPPILLKIYFHLVLKDIIYNDKLISIFYIIPISIGTLLTMIIAGAGGIYVFGHSILDNIGLSFLIPNSFDYVFYRTHYNISFIEEKAVSELGLLIVFLVFILLIIYIFRQTKGQDDGN